MEELGRVLVLEGGHVLNQEISTSSVFQVKGLTRYVLDEVLDSTLL